MNALLHHRFAFSNYIRALEVLTNCANDPYWSNVVLMMHMDGSDNSIEFIDETGKTVSIVGDTKIKKAQNKFGGSAAYFDGSNDYLTLSDNGLVLGTGDFTIECWAYMTSIGSGRGILQLSPTVGGLVGNATNNLQLAFYSSGFEYVANGAVTDVPYAWSINTWYHIALVRASGVVTLYVNGVNINSKADTTNYTGQYCCVGAAWSTASCFNGYIDEVRITKGIARYDSNSTKLLLHFDTTNLQDETGKAVTIGGNATRSATQSKFGGYSGYFDGSGDYLQIAPSSDLAMGTGDFTIEMWFYQTGFTGPIHSTLLDTRTSAGDTGGISINISRYSTTNNIRIVYNGGYFLCLGSTIIQLNTWYHLAVVRHSGITYVYLNGAVDATAADAGNYSSYTNVKIGTNVGNSESWMGYIDELRITKGKALYSAYGDVVLIHFDQPSISDSTGKSVTVYGNTTLSNAQSKFGGYSGYFDGSGDYLQIADSIDFSFGTGDFTIECWIYVVAYSVYGCIFDTRAANINLSGLIFRQDAGTGKLAIGRSGYVVTSNPIPTGQFVHLVGVRASGVMKIFFDGVLQASGTNTENYTDTKCFIGATIDGYGFNGYIDELRVSKGIARYLSDFTPPTQAHTVSAYSIRDLDGNSVPPTQPFTYAGYVVGVSNPIPPVDPFPSCRA